MQSHDCEESVSHGGRGFGGGGAFAAADDRAGVTHTAAGWSGGAGDEAGDGFAAAFLDPRGGFFLFGAADLADYDDAVRLRVVVEHFDDVQVGRAVDGIAANADARGLADTAT